MPFRICVSRLLVKNVVEIFVEIVDGEAVVYRLGTPDVVMIRPAFEDALAVARAEWPDLGIRVISCKDIYVV